MQHLAADGVLPIEKVLALERIPVFGRLSADEARQLAGITKTVTMTAGTPLFPESAPPSLWIVLSGEVAIEEASGERVTAKGGDVIGAFATMAGESLGKSAEVVRGGVALRIDREDMFELLAQRPALLRQLFSGMFGMAATAA
jgi:CRP-like cAMP-binding protein